MSRRGYLGKISAVVTANTGDFSRNLGGAKRDVESFARSVSSSISSARNSVKGAFADIFTPLQKIERALNFGSRKRLDLITPEQVARVRKLVSASEQLAKPLGAAAKEFATLSVGVQGGFIKALTEAQKQTLNVRNEINRTGSVGAQQFGNVQRTVNATVAAITRLAEAQKLVRSLSTGQELRFVQPGFAREAQRAADLQQQAASLPAGRMSRVSSLVAAQRGAADIAAARLANLERIQVTGTGNAAAATDSLNRQVDALKRYNDLLLKEITLVAAATAAEKKRAAARAAATSNRQEVASAVSGRAQNAEQARQEFVRLTAAVKEFDAAKRKAFSSNLQALGRLVAKGDETDLKAVRALIRAIERDLSKQKKLDIKTDEAKKRLEDVRAQLKAVSSSITGRPSDPFDRLAQSATKAKQAIEGVEDARRKASLQTRLNRIEAANTADAGRADLTAAQLAARANRRALQLDGLATSAGRRSATDIFGAPLRSPGQRTDALRSRVSSLQSSVGDLPTILQASLIPKLTAARNAYAAIGDAPTPAKIRLAEKAANDLEKSLKRVQVASQFRGKFGEFLKDQAADKYVAKLQAIQQGLAVVGAKASGPVSAAINKYRAELDKAALSGTLATDRTTKKLERLEKQIIKTARETGLLTEAQEKALLASVTAAGSRAGRSALTGDVSRFGADKFSLAVQQAAFAVDDFFAVTGGLDQRVRAAGNNISQLGFILGGTNGLILGIAGSIGAQLVAAYIKWYNAGVDTEDQLKALNDALQRQKSLVEDLARAYDGVAESIERAGGSKATQQVRDRDRVLRDIQQKQDEQARERIAGLDPAVQRERGIQAARQRQLEKTTDPGERVRLEREIRLSRDREQAAADAAVNAPGAEPRRAVDAVADIRRNLQQDILRLTLPDVDENRRRGIEQAQEERDRFAREQLPQVLNAGGPREQADAARRLIEQEQAAIERSITTGVAGAFDEVSGVNPARRKRLAELEQLKASVEKDVFRDATNKVAIEATKAAIDAANQIGRAQETLANALNGGASQIERELSALNERLIEAENKLKAAQAGGDVDAAETALKEVEAAKKLVAEQESLANSTKSLVDVLDRLSNQLVDTVAQEARSASDQARRRAIRAFAENDLGLPGIDTDFEVRRGRRLRADARSAEDAAQEVMEENVRVRQDFERRAAAGQIDDELKGFIRQRDEAQRVLDDEKATTKQKQDAERQRDEANRAIDRRFEDSEEGGAARSRASEAARNAEASRALDESILRGRELLKTPIERAREEFARSAFDADEALREQGANRAQRDAGFSNLALERAMQVAPMLMGFRDERMNALLQGPSRAALNAADTNTMEGQRELNRLLRGDDPNKDVNLIELQKQSELLQGVIDAIADRDADATVEIRG
jgi:hypothetical protein